ncbi:MAG: tripartite tricarboxylate transporter substrate binding protein [Betaproteobacteria bacterium]
MIRLSFLRLVCCVAIQAFAVVAQAAYPDKPVQYIIPFAPGGESDIAARLQQQVFKVKYNQELIVSNKSGAGGALAWSQLNGMPGDGYMIMGVNLPHIVLQPLEPGTQFKTEDITPVYFFHYTPDALIVLGNHVSGAMSYSTLAIQQKGKMRMLAVATEKRLPQFPDVPTFKELGLNWVDGAYRGIGVPKSTPPDVRKMVSDMMDVVNKDPELRRRMTEGGFEVTDIGIDQVPAFVKERSADYLKAAKGLGMVK